MNETAVQSQVATGPLSIEELQRVDAYWRAANYLSVGQIYLLDNPLLKEPLTLAHVKPRLLGHWGTTPGLNFLYVHLNRVINKHDLSVLYVAGPGHGGPAIVVDLGTATTFDAVSAKGEYLGGVIAPGIGIAAEALFERTAKLPRIDIARPNTVVGKTTVASMQSGLFFGYLGLVEGIVTRMREEMGDDPIVIGTGGLAHLILAESSSVKHVDPLLTLTGLRIIYERNL